MPRIVLDFDPAQDDAPGFASDTSDLVYFLSWAFSARYGANHELSLAALLLRGEFKIDLLPLLTFADRNVEEPADAEALERAWQDAAPLAEGCEQGAAARAGGARGAHPGYLRPGRGNSVTGAKTLAALALITALVSGAALIFVDSSSSQTCTTGPAGSESCVNGSSPLIAEDGAWGLP